MVYAPQRRHATASLSVTTHALALLQHLYHPNVLVFLSRGLVQIQIGSPASVHPQRSLFSLAFIVVLMTLAAVMLHLLDFAAGVQNGKSLVLDFVGQSLVVSYITSHGNSIRAHPSLPFDDLLLPPDREASGSLPSGAISGDIEEGQSLRRRKKGKGPSYAEVDGEEDEGDAVWLDDTEDAGLLSDGRPRKGRLRDPPLIFNLSLPHMLALITSLPAPSAQPTSLLGTTPFASPRTGSTDLPTASTDMRTATTDSHRTSSTPGTGTEPDDEADDGGEGEDGEAGGRTAGSTRLRGAAGLMPGSYWTARRGLG